MLEVSDLHLWLDLDPNNDKLTTHWNINFMTASTLEFLTYNKTTEIFKREEYLKIIESVILSTIHAMIET